MGRPGRAPGPAPGWGAPGTTRRSREGAATPTGTDHTGRSATGGRRPRHEAEAVAAAIEAAIGADGLPPGSRVGTEGELRARYRVGRGVLGEAVALLEARQVATMRPGRHGGLVVAAADDTRLLWPLAVALAERRPTTAALFDARQVLDGLAVELACEHVNETHLARLRALAAAEERARPGPGAPHRRLHAAIAAAGGNPLLASLVGAFGILTERWRDLLPPPADRPASVGAAVVHRAHQGIVDAIVAGDRPTATRRMRRHLAALHQDLDARLASQPGTPAAPPARRQATAVAGRLLADLAAAGWPAGQVLGTEDALRAHYGVGRDTWRAAVRLLASHGAVTTRPGPGGGLEVARPGSQPLTAALAQVLGGAATDPASRGAIREAVEVAAVQRAIGRLDDPARRALRQALDTDRLHGAPYLAAATRLHLVIAELAGNPVLSLLVELLANPQPVRASADPRRPEPGTQVETADAGARPAAERIVARHRRAIDHAHRSLVAAMVAKDVALAQRRMRLHLRALRGAPRGLRKPADESVGRG
jgi:DNA-binding FadR family transcriptional regulator